VARTKSTHGPDAARGLDILVAELEYAWFTRQEHNCLAQIMFLTVKP